MGFKLKVFTLLVIFMQIVCVFNAKNYRRPLESIKPLVNILPAKSVHIVHYLTKDANTFRVEDIPVKNLKINYNREGRPWHAKSTWDGNYNTTGFVIFITIINPFI